MGGNNFELHLWAEIVFTEIIMSCIYWAEIILSCIYGRK